MFMHFIPTPNILYIEPDQLTNKFVDYTFLRLSDSSDFKYTYGITSDGIFTAEQIFSTALLEILNYKLNNGRCFDYKRVHNPMYLLCQPEPHDRIIIYDDNDVSIEDKLLSKKYKYYNEYRESSIPYASFGLLWKEFGKHLVSNDLLFDMIDREFIQYVDGISKNYITNNDIDNNTKIFFNKFITINQIIELFNPQEYRNFDEVDYAIISCSDAKMSEFNKRCNAQFEKAVKFAKEIFYQLFKYIEAKFKDN